MAANEFSQDPGRETTAGSRRERPVQPRGPDGRFGLVHGAYAGRRMLRRPDRRRSLVKAAEAMRDRYALASGYGSWAACPGPVAALIELAVELRLFRRALVRPLYAGQDVPKRFDGVAELERRTLATLGIGPRPEAGALERWLIERNRAKEAKP